MAEGAKVTRIDVITVITGEGIPTTGKRVWFEVEKTKTVDRVDIADSDFSPEAVDTLITERVNQI
ncbi:hypothetical protein LCGC14_3031960, partial [marine sediment metagenome]